MKKPTTAQIIAKVTTIRAANNILWMSLLKLAVTARPREARNIINMITINDRTISEWISKL